MGQQQVRVAVDVEVGRVGDVVAVGLEPAQHGRLPGQKVAGPVGFVAVIGTVERHLPGAVDVVGAAADRAVERLSAPDVVGLVRGDRLGEDQVARPAVVADDEDERLLLAARAGGQLGEVDAAHPVGRIGVLRNGEDVGIEPGALDQAGGGIRRWNHLCRAGAADRRQHPACAEPAVVSEAEDVDRVRRLGGVDEQLDLAAAVDGGQRGVAFDDAAGIAGVRHFPLGRPGLGVFGLNGVGGQRPGRQGGTQQQKNEKGDASCHGWDSPGPGTARMGHSSAVSELGGAHSQRDSSPGQ